MIKNLSILLIMISIFSCNENEVSNNIKNIEIPFGEWKVVESYPTNGPICIFIDNGHTINFQNGENSDEFIFLYTSENVDYSDLYHYKIINDKIIGNGFYIANILDSSGKFVKTELPQKIKIDFVNSNRIHCIIEHGIYDLNSNELLFGEVSDFYAVRN